MEMNEPRKSEEISELGISTNYTEDGNKTAKEVFARIFSEVERLRENGNTEDLKEYVHKIYNRYFSCSPNLFSELSLKDSFEMLLRVNKIDELQGTVGQSGVGKLVYDLASFQYVNFVDLKRRGNKLLKNCKEDDLEETGNGFYKCGIFLKSSTN